MSALSAARGVSQVMIRCEDAKLSGFLDLSNCELMYIADALYMVLKGYDIKRCSFKNNKLKKFPLKIIANFPNMDVLNLEGNQLEVLPDEISLLSRLRGINVAKNRFTTFPEQLFQCPHLALLDLNGNLIEEFDIGSLPAKMPSLKQLHIKDNPISSKVKFQGECERVQKDYSIKIIYK